jgi:diguanylate cyclase (GGDEF)-like protein
MSEELLLQLQEKIRELDAVNAIGRTLTASLDLRDVLQTIMAQLNNLLKPTASSLLLRDLQTSELVFEVAQGENAERIVGLRLKGDEGIAGWTASRGESVLVPDVAKDPRFASRFDSLSLVKTQSVLAVPLLIRGRTLGVIELMNGLVDRPFQPDDVGLVTMLAEFAAIAIDNARSYRQVEELTIIDEHTKLFNSRYLSRALRTEVERSRRFHHPVSLIFFDLDHFKNVNDSYGHAAGTALLAEVGDLLTGSLRTIDVPARYGGDEFVVVLPETLKKAAVDAAARLQSALSRYVFLRERGLAAHVTGSFGVASFPDDAEDAEGLMKAADTAMYEVKQSTRDGISAAGWGIVSR